MGSGRFFTTLALALLAGSSQSGGRLLAVVARSVPEPSREVVARLQANEANDM